MAKLDDLRGLTEGWDGPASKPLDSGSEGNFVAFLTRVPDHRRADAEPMLTCDGLIRLEWVRDGHAYVAEIGGTSLYLCDLAPNASDDRDREFDKYDQSALMELFLDGILA